MKISCQDEEILGCRPAAATARRGPATPCTCRARDRSGSNSAPSPRAGLQQRAGSVLSAAGTAVPRQSGQGAQGQQSRRQRQAQAAQAGGPGLVLVSTLQSSTGWHRVLLCVGPDVVLAVQAGQVHRVVAELGRHHQLGRHRPAGLPLLPRPNIFHITQSVAVANLIDNCW